MSTIDKASLIQIPSGYKNGKLYSVKPNPSYGSEQISNGDFSDGSTGWTVTNGTVTDKYNASMTAYQNGIKVTPFTLSGTYKLVFDLTITSGSCKFDGGGSNSQTYTTSGRKELTITNPTKFEFNAFNLGWVGTLDNVSVKEVLVADGDFTFSRSSSGTRVNSEGLIEVAQVLGTTEEVTNGDFATDTAWNKNANWSISGGVAIADGTSSNDLNQGTTNAVIGKKYFISFDVVSLNQGTFFAKIGGVGVVGNQVGSFSATVTATSTDRLRIIAQSNAIGTIDNVSVIEYIENDVPRLDYSGGASCASLLLEGQSTNLALRSEEFDNATWNKSSSTITANSTTSPDGTTTADKLNIGSGGAIYQGSISATPSTDYTFSFYAKNIDAINTRIAVYDESNLAFIVSDVSYTITDSWARYLFTFTTPSGCTSVRVYPQRFALGSGNLYLWGAMVEQGSYATSYIPTSGATVTRTADVCNNAGTSATFNDSEGVLFAEIAALYDDGTNRGIAISDGTSSNRVLVYYTTTTNQITALYTYSGTTQVSINETLTDSTQFIKFAFKYKENDCAFWINGIEVGTDNTATAFAADTLNTLNFDSGSGGSDFYGNTKQLMVFDEALSDEELSDLTGQVNLSFNNLATFYGYTIL